MDHDSDTSSSTSPERKVPEEEVLPVMFHVEHLSAVQQDIITALEDALSDFLACVAGGQAHLARVYQLKSYDCLSEMIRVSEKELTTISSDPHASHQPYQRRLDSVDGDRSPSRRTAKRSATEKTLVASLLRPQARLPRRGRRRVSRRRR